MDHLEKEIHSRKATISATLRTLKLEAKDGEAWVWDRRLGRALGPFPSLDVAERHAESLNVYVTRNNTAMGGELFFSACLADGTV